MGTHLLGIGNGIPGQNLSRVNGGRGATSRASDMELIILKKSARPVLAAICLDCYTLAVLTLCYQMLFPSE